MKYLKPLKTFESDNLNDIKLDIKDILIDITNDGKTEIKTIIRFTAKDYKLYDIIDIRISGSFNPLHHIESFDHLNSYMNSLGFVYYPDGTFYENWEKRRKSFYSDNNLSYMGIKFIKKQN
jgi:hypothetical protein